MNKTWLVLDCDYLSYRAFYTKGNLSFEGGGTGVIYGILQDITKLQRDHLTNNIIFCFDQGKSRRCEIFPGYKAKRHEKERTEEEQIAHKDMKVQVGKLRWEILKELGYKNIFSQAGYEADDIIAQVVDIVPKRDYITIISVDHDLYQLLSDRVIMYNPYRLEATDEHTIYEKFGVHPSDWPEVKAIAGCNTDNIPGVVGAGESTAAKYVSGRLGRKSKVYQKIQESKELIARNLKLVKLPFPGLHMLRLSDADDTSPDKWKRVIDGLGMYSLANRGPSGTKSRSAGFGL